MPASLLGVRVHGDSIEDADVCLNELFKAVPVPTKLGIPLVYKKMSGTGGDDSHIRSNAIVRFMADPEDGMAPDEWQYGGRMGPAPPIVLARRDGLPFSKQDWHALDEYMAEWREEITEGEDEGPLAISERWIKPEAFRTYLRSNSDASSTAMLSLRYPVGSTVVASGLSATELNGKEGQVLQYSRDRVGVQFAERPVIALKPERLELLREPALEPATKRQDTGQDKESKSQREAEVAKKEALLIATRFIECLHQDTFPEMGEFHLFGIGGEYRARAQEALAVWQAAAKNDDINAEQLAEALLAGTQRELFMELCQQISKSRLPNATYAKSLVEANFAALEFDTL